MADSADFGTVSQQPTLTSQPRPTPQATENVSLSALEKGEKSTTVSSYESERLNVEVVDIDEGGFVTSRYISATHQEELKGLYEAPKTALRVLIVAPEERSGKLYSDFWTKFTSDDDAKDATWGSLDFWVFKSVLRFTQHGAASIPILAKPGRMKEAADYPAIKWVVMPGPESPGATMIISFPVDKADSTSLFREERYSKVFLTSLCEPGKRAMLQGPLERRSKIVVLLLLTLIGRQSHYNLRTLQEEETNRTEHHIPEPGSLRAVKDYTRLARDYVDMFKYTLQSLDYMDNSPQFKLLPAGDKSTDIFLDEANAVAEACVRRAKDLREAQDRRFDFLTFEINMHESQSVKRLTVLATIFLPLSLGTGLLSMQSRISEMGPIFFDYAGVIMNIGALIVLYMVLVNNRHFELFLRKLRSDTLFRILPAFIFFSALIVFVIAFNIGMFDSIPKSLPFFRYGFIAIGSLVLLAIIIQVIIFVAAILFLQLVERSFMSVFKILVSCCLSCCFKKYSWGKSDDDD